MHCFEDDQNVNGDQNGKTDIDGLGFKPVLDMNLKTNTATATSTGWIGKHHGANEHEQSKRDLATSVGEQVGVHGQASTG